MTMSEPILPADRDYLMARRQAILIELGAIERRLDLPRTKEPNHERKHPHAQPNQRPGARAEHDAQT